MQVDGLFRLMRPNKLGDKDLPLHVARRDLIIMVESDLADGDRLGQGAEREIFLFVLRLISPRLFGVTAHGAIDALVALRQLACAAGRVEVEAVLHHGEQSVFFHARDLFFRVQTRIEKMAMAVDEHQLISLPAGMSPSGASSLSPPCLSLAQSSIP